MKIGEESRNGIGKISLYRRNYICRGLKVGICIGRNKEFKLRI